MNYDYEIDENTKNQITPKDYKTLENFLKRFSSKTDPDSEEFISFCKNEGYDYYIQSMWKKVKVRTQSNTKDSIRVFYIYLGIGMEKLDREDDYLAVVCPIKLLNKKMKRIVGLTVYPKTTMSGKIEVPEGTEDILGYIHEHFGKICFEEPEMDFTDCRIELDEEELEK